MGADMRTGALHSGLLGVLLALSPLSLPGCQEAQTEPDTGSSGVDVPFQLALPFASAEQLNPPVIGMDHDPEMHDGIFRLVCTGYHGEGFPYCYDEHDGSDFLLLGGFDAMDAGSLQVLAAAPGEVVSVEDGNYDRCHGDLESADVDCDGYAVVGNHVIIEHPTGYRLLYWHFMKDSILVQEGEQVETGDALGLVGSSGYSSTPHLHLELNDPEGEAIDPYAGEWSQPESWWCQQPEVDGFPGPC